MTTTIDFSVEIAEQIRDNLAQDLGGAWPLVQVGHVPSLLEAVTDRPNAPVARELLPAVCVTCELASNEDLSADPGAQDYSQSYEVTIRVWVPWDLTSETAWRDAKRLVRDAGSTFHLHYALTDDGNLVADVDGGYARVARCRLESSENVLASRAQRIALWELVGHVWMDDVTPTEVA